MALGKVSITDLGGVCLQRPSRIYGIFAKRGKQLLIQSCLVSFLISSSVPSYLEWGKSMLPQFIVWLV